MFFKIKKRALQLDKNKGKASNCYTESRKAKREDTVVMTAVLADEEKILHIRTL